MKKDLFYRDCFGRNCPTVVNDKGRKYEVRKSEYRTGYLYEIVKFETWYITDALEYEDKECSLFLWTETPKFESKAQAVRYMIENANRFI